MNRRFFAALQGGKLFSKSESGLFQFERLPFENLPAPSIFQHLIENLILGLTIVCVYIYDILVCGTYEADHVQKLEQVLSHLLSAGILLKWSKCTFATTSVEYLGHIITEAEGGHPILHRNFIFYFAVFDFISPIPIYNQNQETNPTGNISLTLHSKRQPVVLALRILVSNKKSLEMVHVPKMELELRNWTHQLDC